VSARILAAALLTLIVSARTHLTLTVLGEPVVIPVLWLIAAAVVLVLAALVLILIRCGVRDGWLHLRPVVVTT
jgi:hypothetical protein